MTDVIILASGGIKSTVAAAREARQHEVLLVHLNYGQAAAPAERNAVVALAGAIPGAESLCLDLPYVAQVLRAKARDPRTNQTAPVTPVSMRGFVPTMLGAAGHVAVQYGASRVVLGMNARVDDTLVGYMWSIGVADTRRELAHAFNIVAESGFPSKGGIQFDVPLIDISYGEVIRLAQSMNLPLGSTWSCEVRSDRPCERCAPCKARSKAFGEAHRSDPMLVGAR